MANPDDAQIRDTILTLVNARGAGKTICPSEAAKELDSENWRSLLSKVRRTAQAMAKEDRIAIYRKGKPIEPDAIKGVIRLGLRP
jgi:hypothetical protein